MKKIMIFCMPLAFICALTVCAVSGGAKVEEKTFKIGYNSVTVKPVNAKLAPDFVRGFDASAVNDPYYKDKYLDDDGSKKDVFEILKNHGVNWIRLRIWNDPENKNNPEVAGASNLENVVDQAGRAKKYGMKVLLDFHYSDYWADPGKQAIPQEWKDCKTPEEMALHIEQWTEKVLASLNQAGASPDMIQIGNEINSGILTGYYQKGKMKKVSAKISGSSSLAKANYVKYLESGINAARKVCPSAKIMLHVAEGGGEIAWLLDIYKNANLDYDVIGLSYYPFEKSHGKLENLSKNIKSFQKTYKKDVVIAETAHPWKTDAPKGADLLNATNNLSDNKGNLYEGISSNEGTVLANPQNQANVIRAVIEVSANAGAKGVFVWGGEYSGSWKYGMFDDKGLPLPSLHIFEVQGN